MSEALSTRLTIGIAACSSEGAALCYRTICACAPARLGPYDHPEIVLHAPSLAGYVAALEDGDLEAVAALMLRSAGRLKAAGADFVICPDNTIHAAMPLVRDASPLPWLHIAETVAEEARRRGVTRAAILGTKWLVDSDVYPDALVRNGVGFLRPEPRERDEINRIIMDELVNDMQVESSVRYFQALIETMKERGCDAAILGCTEIPIIISDANAALPVLDSTRLLADAALNHAIAQSRGPAGVPA
ncbi:aspartate/glutamate racemase family protein [Pelagibius sp.]|uniref:aspartate/glutamate racemase family protein n=1 Tax=Pelagibius sp. TaxID=1931238 RepID=UPI00261E859A|nr:amino acid racemase [Pelagibius sp.]